MPPAKLGLVYSHTGLRRFIDAIGAPRTRELFLLGRNIDARDRAAPGAWSTSVVAGRRTSRSAALELAAELAANAPLSHARQQARDRARCCAAEGELDPDVEERADRAARGVLRLRGHARGRARVRREAPGALAAAAGLGLCPS